MKHLLRVMSHDSLMGHILTNQEIPALEGSPLVLMNNEVDPDVQVPTLT